MLLATTVNLAQLGALGGVATACTILGGWAGKLNQIRATKQRNLIAEHDETKELLAQITKSIVGTPASEWGPAKKGLIEQMVALDDRLTRHINEELASRRVLDTASRAADKIVDTATRTADKLAASTSVSSS